MNQFVAVTTLFLLSQPKQRWVEPGSRRWPERFDFAAGVMRRVELARVRFRCTAVIPDGRATGATLREAVEGGVFGRQEEGAAAEKRCQAKGQTPRHGREEPQ